MLSLLLFSLLSDSPPIHTTVSDSSRVAFIAQTPVTWNVVEHDSLRYIRFSDSPLADRIGYPELPMITCLVAVPDSVTPELEYSTSDERILSVMPVYPAPAHYISNLYTPALVDSFVQDSLAYCSDEFWPSERVRIIGELKICDQRLLQVQCFPAQYRSSDSTLSIVSSFSVSVSFDSSEAVWSNTGLGHFQSMVSNSPIVGYKPREQSHAPVPIYFGEVDPEDGPSRMPDYLILCASGLYDQCKVAIDSLAEHRVSLNSFDVALVTTDSILADFGGSSTAITSSIIRDFTEHMWREWGDSTSNKTPDYLLLIGDHEASSFSNEPWFLPTHQYPYEPGMISPYVGNDEWYTYFNQPDSVNNAFPEMCVGRLSVKNDTTLATDTLSSLIYNLIDLEDPITQVPLTDYRRRILRLAGTGQSSPVHGIFKQTFGILNTPHAEWTNELSDWMNYDFTSHYCGDGRSFTDTDSSLMSSAEWVDSCLVELNRGAGVAFYTNHGELHMFSAGLEWCPSLYSIDDTKGARDSTFNNYQIENYLNNPASGYSAPFVLSLSCSNGTFNHTIEEHTNRTSHTYFCFDYGSDTIPAYDFGTDCLAEKLLKNTDAPVAGVFAGSRASNMNSYEYYGKGILEAIYARGEGRLGDAIASARFQYSDYFAYTNGFYAKTLGQFNLLGDPALDISDRVRYPQMCDLTIYTNDVTISEYPVEASSDLILPFSFTIYNFGAQASDAFNTKVTFSHGFNTSTINISCASIAAGDSAAYEGEWICPTWVSPPMEVEVTIEADDGDNCEDSWRGNNTFTSGIQLNDTYPVDSNWVDDYWIKNVEGNITTTPILANLDSDDELEVVVLSGSTLEAYEDDGTLKWKLFGEGFSGVSQPLAIDLDDDRKSEIILIYSNGIKIVRSEASLGGVVQQTILTSGNTFAVGDMDSSTSGLELCVADGRVISLYEWNDTREEYVLNLTKTLGELPTGVVSTSLSCGDLGGSSKADAVLCVSYGSFGDPSCGYLVYDWDAETTLQYNTWNRSGLAIHPAVGELAETAMLGLPQGSYSLSTEKPALLLEIGETPTDCDGDTVFVSRLKYGVFADWDPFVSGADAFILPSEMQCFAWDSDGDALDGFATPEYQGATFNSDISPTALGDLNNSDLSDVLFSTELSGVTNLLAFDSDGFDLVNFPIALPDSITAYGGFAIADIDRDGKVEVVFGSSDGRLHCWELGSCAIGYAPWTQFQHDYGRTGVLD